MSQDPIISLQGVEKVYKTKAGEIHALRGVDFEVQQGGP